MKQSHIEMDNWPSKSILRPTPGRDRGRLIHHFQTIGGNGTISCLYGPSPRQRIWANITCAELASWVMALTLAALLHVPQVFWRCQAAA